MTLIQMINEAGLGNTPISIEQFKALESLIRNDEGKRLFWECEQTRYIESDIQHSRWYNGYDACLAKLESFIGETK